jgi:two-component system sensor histidine kinase MtrB
MREFDWRAWLDRAARLWRSSLQVRTVAITVVLSGLAVAIIGGYMAISIGTNLFDDRRVDLERTSANATLAGQRVFDQAAEGGGFEDLETTLRDAVRAIQSFASSTGGTQFAIFESGRARPGIQTRLPISPETLITPELREALRSETEPRTVSQSVGLLQADGSIEPGLVFGSALFLRGSPYELYLVYNIADAQETLGFVQQTLALGGLALILLIGAVTYIVVRLVVGPVQLAAETSEKLAAGQLEVRIPVKGDDVIATLARSFNGMAASLQSQITRLAALSQVQQRFVSDVSHELRTPLTTIRLAGDVLYDQRDSFPPATARTAELLHTQVERFELLLADLLEMSRYDAGAVDMETEPTNLVRLVEDAISSVQSLADSKGSQLRLVAPGGYFEAEVDVRRIRRILQNLLGNAIDHGEGKPIVIHVDSDANAVAIAVRDYGVGMTPAAMERVFDRFWRADPSRQRTTGGTGLGLAIALEDAALHGGWLEVWSAPGEGSCFRLTIPRSRGAVLASSPLELPPDDDIPLPVDSHG